MEIKGSLYNTGMESIKAVLVADHLTYVQNQQGKWQQSNFNGHKLLNSIRYSGFKLEHVALNYRLEVQVMREIKFRGKRIDNGEWVYGDLCQLQDGRIYIINHKHGACIDACGNFVNTEEPFVCQVDPATVGQYTGLKDKNGIEICEGDILEEETGYYFEVIWDKKYAKFKLQWRTRAYQYPEWNRGTNMQAIGNIYDNPELLEV